MASISDRTIIWRQLLRADSWKKKKKKKLTYFSLPKLSMVALPNIQHGSHIFWLLKIFAIFEIFLLRTTRWNEINLVPMILGWSPSQIVSIDPSSIQDGCHGSSCNCWFSSIILNIWYQMYLIQPSCMYNEIGYNEKLAVLNWKKIWSCSRKNI